MKYLFPILCVFIPFLAKSQISHKDSVANLKTESEPLYNIRFVRAAQYPSENNHEVHVIFLVTPKMQEDFPPVISTKIVYSLNNQPDYKADLVHPNDHIRGVAYDQTVKEKSKKIYELIKDSVDLNSKNSMAIIEFIFLNPEGIKVENMSMVYGLWEKQNTNLRVEKRYYFHVEQL